MSILKVGSKGHDVRLLQERLQEFGYLDDAADGIFGPITAAAVSAFQSAHGLDVDSMVGTQTRTAIDEEVNTALRHAGRERDNADLDIEPQEHSPLPGQAEPAGSTVGDAGRASRVKQILAAATEEWNRPVHEPRGEGWERIDTYIRGAEGLGWSSEDRYVRNRQFAWCGAFAAFCFEKAGLKADIRRRVMPSTYRLYKWAKNTERMREIADVQRGDIVIVGPKGGKRWGSHITICDEADAAAGFVHTLEGNASGRGPNDDRYEGVIRHSRPLPGSDLPPRRYRVVHVIRPLAEDYE
jgi:hypothetical protein